MRILMINPRVLFPLESGAAILDYNLLRTLAAEHEVTYIALVRSEEEGKLVAELEPFCEQAFAVRMPNTRSVLHRLVHWVLAGIKSTLTLQPVSAYYHNPRPLRRLVSELSGTGRYDIVQIHQSPSAGLVGSIRGGRSVLVMYDIQHVFQRELAIAEGGRLVGLARRVGALQMRRYERRWIRRYDLVLTAQEDERVRLQHLVSGPSLEVLPAAIDTERLRSGGAPANPAHVVFVGVMNYHPNVEAAIFFAQEIWPHVLARAPGATFDLVGRDPTARVQALQDGDGIRVIGHLPSVEAVIANAACYVVPARIGTGIKVKLLVAMAMGKAIVTTSRGVSGVPVTDEENVLIRDDPREFADAVVKVITDDQLRGRLERNARAFAVEHYGFQAAERAFARLYGTSSQ